MKLLAFIFILAFNAKAQNVLDPQIDDFDRIVFYTTVDYQYYLKPIYESWAISQDSDMINQITFIDPRKPRCAHALKLNLERTITGNTMLETLRFINCNGRMNSLVIQRTGENLTPSTLSDLMLFRLPRVRGTTEYSVTFNLLGLNVYHRSDGVNEEGKFEFYFLKYNWWLEYSKQVSGKDAYITYKDFYKIPPLNLSEGYDLGVKINSIGNTKDYTFLYKNQNLTFYAFLLMSKSQTENLKYHGYTEEFADFFGVTSVRR